MDLKKMAWTVARALFSSARKAKNCASQAKAGSAFATLFGPPSSHLMETLSPPYPAEAAGNVIASAAIQHSANTGVSPTITALAALGCATAAVHDLIDMQRPGLAPSPVTALTLICAGSGSGKTTGARPFLEPILDLQAKVDYSDTDPALTEAARELHAQKTAILRAEARKLLGAGLSTDELLVTLGDHQRYTPGVAPSLVFDYLTPAAALKRLARWPSALIFSPEADHLLRSRLGTSFDMLNAIWDGESLRSHTAADAFVVHDPRVSALLFTQTAPALRFMQRSGTAAFDTGFFARADFIHLPEAGIQMVSNEEPRTAAIRAFQARARDLLTQAFRKRSAGDHRRRAVRFSRDGTRAFHDLRRRTHDMTQPGREFYGLSGYAAKLPERIARKACVIHTFNDLLGDISSETLAAAEQLIVWQSRNFFDFVRSASPQTRIEQDAILLEQLIGDALWRGRTLQFSHLTEICPATWRRPRRLQAWQLLEHTNRARLLPFKGKRYVQLAQSYASQPRFIGAPGKAPAASLYWD